MLLNNNTRIGRPPKPPVELFWAKVNQDGPLWNGTPCWLWTGKLEHGYGRLHLRSGRPGAHRFAYELLVGPIPENLQIDHLCRNRACVNPAHLEPVTSRTNTLRGTGPTAQFARLDRCRLGHPFDLFNTYVKPDGARICRICRREWKRRQREQQRITSPTPSLPEGHY